MSERVVVHPGLYADSVSLMLLSRDASSADRVQEASIVMGTPLNVGLLRRRGFDVGAGEPGPNDLVIAVRARDDAALASVLGQIDERLAQTGSETRRDRPAADAPSLRAARRRRPDLDVALVSVPGEHAPFECAVAVEEGMHVFCFSAGLTLEEEVTLKRRALARGLLFMGPDCGTAIVGGVGLGFANAVRQGPVGIAGASGTGIQQVACLLDAGGVGISHAIGLGGRDLGVRVGGLMARRAIELLAADDATEAIVVIAKSPDGAVAAAIADAAARSGTPSVLAFPGLAAAEARGLAATASLEDAAAQAARLVGVSPPRFDEPSFVHGRPGAIRGLFCGGTLCDEARTVAAGARAGADIGDRFVDFGAEELTRGRPHPMIDPSLRNAQVETDARDRRVGAILVDVVLGFGAHPDPAAELAASIQRAVAAHDGAPAVIVSLCGAADDPQGLTAQAQRLHDVGAVVTRSNAQAARLAVEATTGARRVAGRR